MTLLVAVTGWDVEPWVRRFQHFLPDLKIVTLGEPFDRRDVEYAAAWRHPRLPEVPIVRVVDADLTERMSEYVVLHCLMHLRQQRRYDAQQRQKIWLEESHPPAARDVRVGVMGLGVLGSDAARKLRMMGFDVAGWSRSRSG